MQAPSLKDELERKSLTALENLLRKREQKRINDDQLEVGLQAVFDAVWGLVGDDINEIIVEAQREPDPSYVERRLLRKGGHIAILERRVGGESFRIRVGLKGDGSWAVDKVQDYSDEVIPTQVCAEKFDDLLNNMKNTGYQEL